MLRGLVQFSVVFLTLLFLMIAGRDRTFESRAAAESAGEARHRLTGTYYVANV